MTREPLVTPRVYRFESEAAVPLQVAVAEICRRHHRGAIALVGGPGSGKTTALQFLAGELCKVSNLRYFDEPTRLRVRIGATTDVVVYTRYERYTDVEHLAVLRLKTWDQDDLIEFVLAAHKDDCPRLMERIKALPDQDKLEGQPELWRIVIAALAADEKAGDPRTILRAHMAAAAPNERRRKRLALTCLRRLLFGHRTGVSIDLAPERAARPRHDSRQLAWLKLSRHAWVRQMLAADALLEAVRLSRGFEYLDQKLLPPLIEEAGKAAALDGNVRLALAREVGGDDECTQANAASILNATGAGWMPKRGTSPVLDNAYLPRAHWAGAVLPKLRARRATFARANLTEARLELARAEGANLSGAWLMGAFLYEAYALSANFNGARMKGVNAKRVCFDEAMLVGTDLEDAQLSGSTFRRTDLSRANLQRADMRNALFQATDLTGTDLRGARLEDATFMEIRMDAAQLLGALFVGAGLSNCNLEGVTVPTVNFAKAVLSEVLLTDSCLPHAIFRGASLWNCGLAGIEWEGADLRDSILTGSTFHLGSSRSGLVGSTIACEGSKTGFYSDDFEELKHKPPEEIRKANLRGADLRGANIDGVDFYLVDLRDALLDAEQVRYVRKCGAILETT